MIKRELIDKYYPPDKFNGTKLFYDLIGEEVNKDFTVLNFGAGRTSSNKIKSMKGKVKSVYGVDMDERVLSNQDLDIQIHLQDNLLPFEDNFFDFIWSDFVMEHLEVPSVNLKEIYRVLKPNASFYFRTPNIYHYVSFISRLTPHWFHVFVAKNFLSNSSEPHEPFETYYRVNSKKDILKLATEAGFSRIDLRFIEMEPSYLLFNRILFYVGLAYERAVNKSRILEGFRANIFGKLTK